MNRMKEYIIALINLIFGNIYERKGLILLGIFLGTIFFYGAFSINDFNTKIFFAIFGFFSWTISLRFIFKKK
jgi:hypothetical protein